MQKVKKNQEKGKGADGMQVDGGRTSSWEAWVLPDHRVLSQEVGGCVEGLDMQSRCAS